MKQSNKIAPSEMDLKGAADSEDSFDKAIARVDKDISKGIYDKDLVLEDKLKEDQQEEDFFRESKLGQESVQ